MGLASALSTALTGLTAAETTIDVVGNNLANSNTVGFKASTASFATQFLQTRSLGSGPTDASGGTNPRQIGLGTMVADITPNFGQGTIEISSNPTDLAIQGDGFFIVQGKAGDQLYTRNGVFKLNANSELTTITGNRLLGFGVDQQFQIQTTGLVPLSIPLGAKSVAKATENVFLEGTLSPTGDLADRAQNIQTGILTDGIYPYPDHAVSAEVAINSGVAFTTATPSVPPGNIGAGTYYYKMVYADGPKASAYGTEGAATAFSPPVVVAAPNSVVDLSGWTTNAHYSYVHFYRTAANPADPATATYYFVGEAPMAGPFQDNTADNPALPALDTAGIGTAGAQYRYYVSFRSSTQNIETRPILLTTPVLPNSDQRVHLYDIPNVDPAWAAVFDQTCIYRNRGTDTDNYYRVVTLPVSDGSMRYTDRITDAALADTVAHPLINLDNPPITAGTLLQNVVRRDSSTYSRVFDFTTSATLEFTGRKGGRSLSMKEMTIDNASTVQDLMSFMLAAMGVQSSPGPDPAHPIPADANSGLNPGGYVQNGRIRLVGNNGVDNVIDVGLSGMKLVTTGGQQTVNMPFSPSATAAGESAVADFVAFDSLGIPVSVRLTAVLESRTSTSTTYRWFADSPDNQPISGVRINVGTGLITFDGEGNFTSTTESTISVYREHVASASPLEFDLDFSKISGLAAAHSSLAISRQDGSAPGVLTSFIVGEDGRIRGVFSNGITRDLGQIRLVRFGNAAGLEQKGENMFASGVNSGLPVEGNPNEQGIGSIIAGAQELSNTDIGGNLIDLILASTMYRANTRVITTVQQMFDELLSLRR